MTQDDIELLQIFRAETYQRLCRIDATLLAVKAGQTGGDSIASLFRDVHTINGDAGMAGFDDAKRIAQETEKVLERAREMGILEPGLAAGLLQTAGLVRRAVGRDFAPRQSPFGP